MQKSVHSMQSAKQSQTHIQFAIDIMNADEQSASNKSKQKKKQQKNTIKWNELKYNKTNKLTNQPVKRLKMKATTMMTAVTVAKQQQQQQPNIIFFGGVEYLRSALEIGTTRHFILFIKIQ